MILLFQMRFLPQLNSHAYKVYINSGETHFYSNILAILNPTIIVEVEDIGNRTSSTQLYGPTDLQKGYCPNNIPTDERKVIWV